MIISESGVTHYFHLYFYLEILETFNIKVNYKLDYWCCL